MRFIVEKAIFEKFPDLNIGIVIAKGIDNSGISKEITESLREKETEIRENFDAKTLSQNPKIDVWRKAYSAFGAKPKDNLSSVENLYRHVLKGTDMMSSSDDSISTALKMPLQIRHINKIVDIYNLFSLKFMVPLGGEDMDKIQGDVKLTIAGPNEPAALLLGDKEPRLPHEGEVIYKDDVSAICRRFNWREADRTKFTEQTRNAVLVAEGLPPITVEDIENIVNELKNAVQKYCGGEISLFVLNQSNPEIEF